MRMRLKKHLDERIENCGGVLLAREGNGYYKLTAEERRKNIIDLKNAFAKELPVCLELGCGKGGWAIESAKRNPEKNYVAVEKLSNVIVVACENAAPLGLPNLKFLNCRAENLLDYLPKHCVKEIALNFSCPFPKKTYANRRLTSKNYLQLYKELLTRDGIIYQKTDDEDFFDYSIESYQANGYVTFDVTRNLPENEKDNVVTEYEAKFRESGKSIYALKAKLK